MYILSQFFFKSTFLNHFKLKEKEREKRQEGTDESCLPECWKKLSQLESAGGKPG